MQIRMVTLYQPWASLMPLVKGWETRPPGISWKNYRGILFIHSALRKPSPIELAMIAEPVSHSEALELLDQPPDRFVLGKIVAVCRMTDTVVMTPEFIAQQTLLERAVGNWEPGRLVLKLEDRQAVPEPVPATGGQGMRQTLVYQQLPNLSCAI